MSAFSRIPLRRATAPQVAAHLLTVEHLSVFVDALGPLDGEALSALTTLAAIDQRAGRKYQRSLLIDEVQRLLREGFPAPLPAAAALRDGCIALSAVDAPSLPAWLAAIDCALPFASPFIARGIDGEALSSLSADALRAMNVGTKAQRATLLAAVAEAARSGVDATLLLGPTSSSSAAASSSSAVLPALSSLDAVQAARWCATATEDLDVFAEGFLCLTSPLDGERLASLTMESLKTLGVGRTYQHRRLIAAIAAARREGGVRPHRVAPPAPPPLLARLASSDFKALDAGDVDAPRWDTADAAACSTDGATGVIFLNTAAGGFVVKASQNCGAEAVATSLALAFGLPAARMRLVSYTTAEFRDIKSAIIDVSDSSTEVRMKLHSTFNRPVIMIIELVSGAELLFGLPPSSQSAALDSSTEAGARRLRQLGELTAFDAFLNNSDRVPVVHSNRGNARNVLFSRGADDEASDIVAIDQVVTSLSESSEIGARLYRAYTERVGAWLAACLRWSSEEDARGSGSGSGGEGTSEEDSMWRTAVASGATYYWQPSTGESAWVLPKGAALAPPALRRTRSDPPASLPTKQAQSAMGKLQCIYGDEVDAALAEACVRAAGFSADMAQMFIETPALLDYARRRGPGAGAAGSLLCVRDFIARNAMIDVGDAGIDLIREGVCAFARRVAAMPLDAIVGVHDEVAASVSEGTGIWEKEMAGVRVDFLERMHAVFKDAVSFAEEEER